MKNTLASSIILGSGLLAAALIAPARAAIPVGPNGAVQVGGFFSQGYLYSSDINHPTANKGGTWDFREMAVNVSTTIGSRLRLGGQAFAQRLGEIGGDKVILDWAVADYNFDPAFGVRAGRVKYPKGLYGEALDLDVVRPYVFLPNSVYSPVLRDFAASFDGALVYGTLSLGKSTFDYKVFYGDIPISPEKGIAEFYNDTSVGLYAASGVSQLSMDSVTGGQLVWNTPVSGLRFAYSYSFFDKLNSNGPFAGFPAANLNLAFGRFSYDVASVEYTWKDWVFAAEWQRAGATFKFGAAPFLPTTSGTYGTDGWYVSAARRLNAKFEIGTYYGDLRDRYNSRDSRDYQKDFAVSLRYDLNEHVLFKIEAHRIGGTYGLFNTARIPNPAATRKDEDTVFAAKTTFSF